MMVENRPSRSPLCFGGERPKRLIIIDNSLVDERGHHLALARTLVHAADDFGIPVSVYCHRECDARLLPPQTDLRSVFGVSVYEMLAAGPPYMDLSAELVHVLQKVEEENPQGGLVLFHTADAYTFTGLADWLGGVNATGNRGPFSYQIATPYEPQLMPGAVMKGNQLHQAMTGLAHYQHPYRTLSFWSETARLAHYYERAYGMKTSVLPFPAAQWTSETADGDLPCGDKLVLLFLGAAREEKGFLRLPELADAIAGRPELTERVIVRIQYSSPISGLSPSVRDASAKLRRYKFVEIIEGALSVDGYAREMHGCDAALLPYNPHKYYARGSGIVMEALCCGKYILASRGTFMEDLPHDGLCLLASNVEGWLSFINILVKDISKSRARSAKIGQRLAQKYSGRAYLSRLIARIRHNPFFRDSRPAGYDSAYRPFQSKK